MPIYEYQCTACGHHFDTIQTFKDEALIHCPVCGEATLKKLISAPAFHLKGTGWYATDFKNQTKPTGTASQENKGTASTKAEQETVKKDLNTVAKESKSTIKKSDKAEKKSDKADE
jgi:putative FmdB family regulatory protein